MERRKKSFDLSILRSLEVEIRPVFEAADFAASDPTGEVRAAEARLRQQTEVK